MSYFASNNGIFGILSNNAKIEGQLKMLENAYSAMPSTLGCTGCGKCCQVQHPHCYYIEFINMMRHIEKNWTEVQLKKLQLKCVENYLSNDLEKECIFLKSDMSCGVYKARDYNCRAFGIIPKGEYKRRYKEKRKQFKGASLSLKRQQDCCAEVRPEKEISAKALDSVFETIYEIDKEIGVSISDLQESNNYLTFHDHYMLHFYHETPEILQQITELKTNGTDDHKKEVLQAMAENMGVDYE